MPAKIRRIDFSPDEWIAGTIGMTPEEEGLYIRICVLIWSRGERITYELLKGACGSTHGNKINAILRQLEVAGKITRNGSEIGQKRAENELENARKRVGNARENASKRWKHKGLRNADASQRSNANHQPSTGKEERFSHKELNLSVLTPREATPPLPSQGDGVAASRSRTTKEAEVNSDDLITPEEKAAALAELHRMFDVEDKRRAASLNGHAGVC